MKKIFLSIILALLMCMPMVAQDRTLPAPRTNGGIPLMDAIAKRHSSREFKNTLSLSNQQLSDLLWATCGYNRPGKRTVASAMNKQEMSAYVITPQAVYKYDPTANKLVLVNSGDFRHACSLQDFARNADLNIALVADLDLQPNEVYAGMTMGAMSENIYLWCASQNMNTVGRASFDKDALTKALNLKSSEKVMLVQTVGK